MKKVLINLVMVVFIVSMIDIVLADITMKTDNYKYVEEKPLVDIN